MKLVPGRTLAALIVAATCATACADLLGVGGSFESVIDEFCKCDVLDARWPKNVEATEYFTCKEYVAIALESGSPEALEWIASFTERGCDQCANALACSQQPPLCIAVGSDTPCDADSSCCGYDEQVPTASYCGFELDDDRKIIGRRCVSDADPVGCASAGESCREDAECCGSAGSLANCADEAGFCFTLCDPDNQILCPGCCAIVNFGVEGQDFSVCVGGLPYDPDAPPVACENTCVESCPFGLGCGRVEYRLEFDDVNGDPRFTDITITECIALPP